MNSQEAVTKLSDILNLYEIRHHKVLATQLTETPTQLTITVRDYDGDYISVTKTHTLAPFITDEQYADFIMAQGESIIMRLTNSIIVRN